MRPKELLYGFLFSAFKWGMFAYPQNNLLLIRQQRPFAVKEMARYLGDIREFFYIKF